MEDIFPILGSKPIEYIPLNIVKPHEKQAITNHCQTLERLASRGGLGWIEMLYVLKDERYDFKVQISEMDAKTKVLEIVNSQIGLIIKEGSSLDLYDDNDRDCALIEKIIANKDIKIENAGKGYAFLLRTDGQDTNSIFESDKIIQISENNYAVHGYFKDALLIVKSKNCKPELFETYMDY